MFTLALPFRRRNRALNPRAAVAWPRFELARFARLALVLALAATAAALSIFVLNRPIRRVTVDGVFQRVSALEVETAVRGHVQGGFLLVDLAAVRRAVESLPWVDHARVSRRWPAGLYVQVTEQVAAARWGATGLLNTRGELFGVDTRHWPAELPRLDGPAGSAPAVAELYFRLYPRLLEAGLRAAALRESERGAWELELANGVTVRFGRRQIGERIERFLKFGAPVIALRPNDIASVDLRYSNGFAVGWRTPSTIGAPHAAAPPEPTKEPDHDA